MPGWGSKTFLYPKTVTRTSCLGPLVLDSPVPGFIGGKALIKNGSSNKMDYHSFRNPPEGNGRSGRSDTLLDGPIEPFNNGYMFLIGHAIEGDAKISHFCP